MITIAEYSTGRQVFFCDDAESGFVEAKRRAKKSGTLCKAIAMDEQTANDENLDTLCLEDARGIYRVF